MTSLEKGVIILIKSALTGKKYALPNDFDLIEAVEVIREQQVSSIVYFGALNCGISQNEVAMDMLLVDTYSFAVISEAQAELAEKISKLFEENKIDYMLLKGARQKKLYPKPEMRAMADIDILIKFNQYEKIKPIMRSLGFSELIQSDHELVWKKDKLSIELHKRLIPSYNLDFYSYFGDGWNKAKRNKDSHCFSLDAEDEFIFIFTHFAKHYRDAGIGIKHLVDLKVYLDSFSLNTKYVLEELKKLKLDLFYANVCKTLKVWFDGEAEDEISSIITKTAFQSGAYGRSDLSALSQALKGDKSYRIKKIFKLAFLPLSKMRNKYPVLVKLPVLLPFMWIARWFDILLFKRSRIKRQVNDFRVATPQKVAEYQKSLNKVGLNYNFKE